MPALRPTPTHVHLVDRQLGDVGGAIGGAATAAGGGIQDAAGGAGGAVETVANAPNAAISAGTDAASDKIAEEASKQAGAKWEDFKVQARTPAAVCGLVLVVVIGLLLMRWRKSRKRKNQDGVDDEEVTKSAKG